MKQKKKRAGPGGLGETRYRLAVIGLLLALTLGTITLLSSPTAPIEVRISDLIPPSYNGQKIETTGNVILSMSRFQPGRFEVPSEYVWQFAILDPQTKSELFAFSRTYMRLGLNQTVTVVGLLKYLFIGPQQYARYILVEQIILG